MGEKKKENESIENGYRELYTAAVQFLTGISSKQPRGLIPMEQAAKEYEISSKRIGGIGKENIGLRPSYKKINQAIGLQEKDFSAMRIRKTIADLQEASVAKHRIYNTLLAGKSYQYILALDEVLEWIDAMVEKRMAAKENKQADRRTDNEDMMGFCTGAVIGEQSICPHEEIYSQWNGVIVGLHAENGAAKAGITEEEKERIFLEVWEEIQNGLLEAEDEKE